MSLSKSKPRLAVVSPFLDKRNGTERIAVEWITRLQDSFEIHLYSQSVEDLDLTNIVWHRIPKFPGPHLANFLWWFLANHLWRAWDRRIWGLRYDLVYSPGVNCLDADAVSVHIIFAEYLQRIGGNVSAPKNGSWPTRLHRKLYYRLCTFLEKQVYTNSETFLILISQKTAKNLARFYGRHDRIAILYLGLDHQTFSPARRLQLRESARKEIGLQDGHFVVLLIGNDWRNKGVPVLVQAMALLRDLPINLLVVSREDPAAIESLVDHNSLAGYVRIMPPRKDVEFYYAAADVYAGPSLEDTFALPPAEAMACGLPVIVSAANGTCEIMTNEQNGLILSDSTNSLELAQMLRRLYEDQDLRKRLEQNAAETAGKYTWERNGRELSMIFGDIVRRRPPGDTQTQTQES
jgi:glycosyltransferase involved in cell wall biosynthesis